MTIMVSVRKPSASAAGKGVFLSRSPERRSTSTSLTAISPENGADSASSAPFSAIRLCPAKTMSVVDSPAPASA